MNQKEIFISKACDKFNDKFDYSQVIYTTAKVKVSILCREHGEFSQTPDKHLQSTYGCPVCALQGRSESRRGVPTKQQKLRVSKEEYLEKVTRKFRDKFLVDMNAYEGITKGVVIVTCPDHGVFKKTPRGFLLATYGCPSCSNNHRSLSKTKSYEDFIALAKEVHRNKYTYPEVNKQEYVNRKSWISVVCPLHGGFKKRAQKHVSGQGCFECRIQELVKQGKLLGGYNETILNRNPELRGRGAYLYYIKVGGLYKIGITTNLHNRLKKIKSESKRPVEVLDVEQDTLINVYIKEQRILEHFKDNRVNGGWSTELFNVDVLPKGLSNFIM